MARYKTPFVIALILLASFALAYFITTKVILKEPEMVTINIPAGLRKEESAGILAEKLGWTDEQIKKFVTQDTATTARIVEGYYAPGTYEIPKDASTYEVADTMRKAAVQLYTPFASKLSSSQWDQALKVASIIQRDAKTEDRFAKAKEIWGNLDANKPIKSDATIQYMKDTMDNYGESWCNGSQEQTPECSQSWKLQYQGKIAKEKGWWNPITEEDKKIDWETFNTYLYPGLPERPISNPGIEAIEAAVTTRFEPDGIVI
jgi:cell division protein YceG involved in septum cleavage